MGALIPGWGVAGLCFALALLVTDAPAWAWVLAAGSWLSVAALVRVLLRLLPSVAPVPVHVAETPVPRADAGRNTPTSVEPEPDHPVAETALSPASECAAMEDVLPAATEVGAAEPDADREVEQEALRYALSHDLRAPLRVIDGFTRIVQEDYGRHLDKLGQDHLERVLAASSRMNGMIDAILAQAQLATEPLGRQDIDLSGLVRDVADEQSVVCTSGSSVEWVIQPGLCAQADITLLRRVVENLLSNALKYSAKVASPRIEFGCMPATNPPVYFVRDNGAGFDMQHADKLFGMFQRLHSAKDFEGTGVGLAGVRHIIRRHGGRIWAEAQLGQGACFYFTLTDRLDSTALPG
ncbi:sensor histidine kinase [Aquabacterium sp. UBA2148]|uniref:sensor histidine kinase n=1 Tax=Aquabacterium sp. UBA2148 TaxID=1946042 RepID=UPI00257B0137|nr:ATP-binding protein [Aquabacterium sp. UBA2148]